MDGDPDGIADAAMPASTPGDPRPGWIARAGGKVKRLCGTQALCAAARAERASGLWFPDSAHVTDPLMAVQAFAQAAAERGAELKILDVRALKSRGDQIEILGDGPPVTAGAAVVCAGMGSQALLSDFGLHAPLGSDVGSFYRGSLASADRNKILVFC